MDAKGAGWIVLGLVLLMSAGCADSAEDKLYEAFKCSKVATQLGMERDANMAQLNATPHMMAMESSGKSPSLIMMEMGQRFQDDVPLYRLSVGGQMSLLSDVYQSDECQALYRPAEGLTQEGDINLAGCKVPAGLTPAQAENVQCSTEDPTGSSEAQLAEDSSVTESELAAAEAADFAASSAEAAASAAAAESSALAGVAAPAPAATTAAPAPPRSTVAPSFDCNAAVSRVEQMICASDRLADLDNRVANQYAQMTRDWGVVPKLIASQRDWISQRNACNDEKCVERAYNDRLGVLANVRVYGSGDVEGL